MPYICMLFVFICVCSSIYANTREEMTPELQELDKQLSSLEKELETLRKKALNAEIRAQPHMIDDWHGFTQEIETAEDNEKHILAIKQKIEELEKQKQSLLDLEESE
jgi:septal ring factor EnvC (AmiA/AmiB activator)